MKRGTMFRLTAVMLAVSFFLTGCGEEKNALMDYKISIPYNDTSGAGTQLYSQSYLSKDVCVIPASKQSKKDSSMTAGASLIVNDTKDKMLYSENIYQKMYPASITKIVTALIVLKYGNLEDKVTISYNASHISEYGAKLCGFAEGDQIKMKKLLYSFLICSGNDAGIAIAEHMAGSVDAFANRMNEEMDDLGAVHSHFVNPHGLHDENHYTTAYDLYLIFHELLQYDIFLDIISQSSYTANFKSADGNKKSLYFLSTDRYLTGTATAPEGITVIGGKTGTTSDAGSCLILCSKDKKNNEYISVILDAESAGSLYYQMNHLLALGG